MFRFARRRRLRRHYLEVAAQVGKIQRQVFEMLRRELVTEYDPISGGQLAQLVVDRLFARPAPLHVEDNQIVESISTQLARDNEAVRDAAFVSLNAMLELEGAKDNYKAERRIIETMHWLARFGNKPEGVSLAQVFDTLKSETNVLKIGNEK
jgi:hypothetical protein